MKIPVNETFQQTIQGEGYWAGTPVDFIRLAGCPVGCSFCDTGFADGGADLPREPVEIDTLISELKSPRVVISGGEPFIHPLLPDLVSAIESTERKVCIETSGAVWREVSPAAWITLSPKEHVSPSYPTDKRFWDRASEVKIVIQDGTELEFYRHFLILFSPVFLQPEWTERDRTLPLVLDMLKLDPSFRLSLQLHKYIGVR